MKFLHILGWAIFLGASWTWCIGMYLPVLLVRDYGIWAFVVFAIPNVVGAAAMAWVLPDAEASKALVKQHHRACRLFSYITIVFHLLFLGLILSNISSVSGYADPDPHSFYPLLLYLPLVAAYIVGFRGGGILLATCVTAFSILAAIAFFRVAHETVIHRLPAAVPFNADIIWLGMVCAFGLALCPYLDLTFHIAREATTPSEGRAAFAIGFGGFFAAALLFTLAYSKWLFFSNFGPVFLPLGLYLLVQSTLKLVLHGHASGMSVMKQILFVAVASELMILLAQYVVPETYHDLSGFELSYRLFMSFYALFFPAYVWICIFNEKPWRLWLVAVLIAAPMYWMGFIERQMIWLLPGVAVPFIAGLLPINRAVPNSSATSPS